MNKTVHWEFATANFRVVFSTIPEECDPADSFDFEEDIEAVRSGAVDWFTALVTVYGPDGVELGGDSLGCCAYDSVRDFMTSHRDADPMNRNCSLMRASHPAGPNVCIGHYFPDMVRQACKAARETMRELGAIKLRH
jgi:hypothetical protein